MNNTIEKATQEALILLGRYIGQEAEVTFAKSYFEGLESIISRPIIYTKNTPISPALLTAVDYKGVESFRITSLRTLDEMTEEEKEELDRIHRTMPLDSRADVYAIKAAQTHYLESIGIDTMGINNKTILIKD